MRLIIGVGQGWVKRNDEIGIDIIPQFKPDIVRDIQRGLPFDDNKFDEVICEHVLEHISGFAAMKPLDNFDFVMNEIWRVLKVGGRATIEVPYYKDAIAYEAAGHIRYFAPNSFINFYQNPCAEELGQKQFSKVISNQLLNTNRSGENEARVIRIVLQK